MALGGSGSRVGQDFGGVRWPWQDVGCERQFRRRPPSAVGNERQAWVQILAPGLSGCVASVVSFPLLNPVS